MTTILLVALTVVGAIISAVIGTLWYSNSTPMGKLHMRYLGMDKLSKKEQQAKMKDGMKMMPMMYAAQIVLSLLTSFAVVFIVSLSTENRLPFVMALGFIAFNWLAFMVPVVGSGILWSNCDRSIAWKKFFSDIFCNLVTLVVIAFVVSFFA